MYLAENFVKYLTKVKLTLFRKTQLKRNENAKEWKRKKHLMKEYLTQRLLMSLEVDLNVN